MLLDCFIAPLLGLELAPIDNKTLILTNPGYTDVYRVNYDPATWHNLLDSMNNSSSNFSPATRAQIVNDFCYFHSLGAF